MGVEDSDLIPLPDGLSTVGTLYAALGDGMDLPIVRQGWPAEIEARLEASLGLPEGASALILRRRKGGDEPLDSLVAELAGRGWGVLDFEASAQGFQIACKAVRAARVVAVFDGDLGPLLAAAAPHVAVLDVLTTGGFTATQTYRYAMSRSLAYAPILIVGDVAGCTEALAMAVMRSATDLLAAHVGSASLAAAVARSGRF